MRLALIREAVHTNPPTWPGCCPLVEMAYLAIDKTGGEDLATMVKKWKTSAEEDRAR